MRNMIDGLFELRVKTLLKDKEAACKFILNHERRHLCIDNLAREVLKTEKSPVKLDGKHLAMIVNDFTNLFIQAAILCKEQELMNSSEKFRLIKQHQEEQELLAELERDTNAKTNADNLNT